MGKVFVENIRERDHVKTPFLVRDKIMGLAKNGRPYMILKLMDKTGEIEGRVWDNVDELSAIFDKDDFVMASGKANVYLGKMQLIVQQLIRLDESEINLEDFLPVSDLSIEEMTGEFQSLVESLANPDLKRLMQLFASDPLFMQNFTLAPAAKTMHHAYLGGLLEHSLAVASLAVAVCERYPDLDKDLLLVGALLHDVGKIEELRYQRSFEYTDSGKLLGHIMLGVELLERKISRLDEFPGELAVQLKHLLLSHHGQYEYGSPKRPKTMEAVILNYLDDLDSKINGVKTHINREPDRDSSWSAYHRQYDRYFYKGDTGQRRARTPATEINDVDVSPGHFDKKPRPRFGNSLEEQLKSKLNELTDDQKEDSDE